YFRHVGRDDGRHDGTLRSARFRSFRGGPPRALRVWCLVSNIDFRPGLSCHLDKLQRGSRVPTVDPPRTGHALGGDGGLEFLCGGGDSDRGGHISVDPVEIEMSDALPKSLSVPHDPLERRKTRRFSDGRATWRLLPWLLLGLDGCALCGGCDESL